MLEPSYASTDEAANIIIDSIKPETIGQESNSFMLVAFQALGNSRRKLALDFLQKQLENLTARKQKWREQRDKEISAGELPSQTSECAVSQTFSGDKKNIWQQSQWETELAYAIVQIDPEKAGVELLSHELAEVRKGAWLAIGLAGNINLAH